MKEYITNGVVFTETVDKRWRASHLEAYRRMGEKLMGKKKAQDTKKQERGSNAE